MKHLKEYIESNSFEDYRAGYILEDGSYVFVDEYHGEDTPYRNLGLPEFSATHIEDVCVRIYKEPNDNQYKKLEYIIDQYLSWYDYCKIECWNNTLENYYFYKIYSLYEGACSDTTCGEEIIGNWSGYKLVRIIKNNINKKAFDRSLGEDYPIPKKLYNIKDNHAYWPDDSEDYIWWDSEAKDISNYANSYKIRLSPKDYLDLTTTRGADSLKLGDNLGIDRLEKLDIERLNKELRQPIFLIVSFKKDPNIAYVVGHEGRHRAFALMNAGIKNIDVQMKCNEYDTSFDRYEPFDLKDFYLVGQFNKNIKINVKDAIPMSWENHKKIRPNLTESSKIQLLYHATNLSKAIKILEDDELKPFAKNYYNVMVSKKPSISFSRDFNFVKNMPMGNHPVIFVLDKEKLKNNYNILPISDDKNNASGPKIARYSGDSKTEEICETPIKNLKKYIIKILCCGSDIDAFRNIKNIPLEELKENLDENLNNSWKNNLFKFLKMRFQTSDTPISRSFLLPDGTFIGTPNNGPHYQIDNVIFNSFFGYMGNLDYDNYDDEDKEDFRSQFNLTDLEIKDIYEHIQTIEAGKLDGSPLLLILGCVRLNGEKENFCEIPSKEQIYNLTRIQYEKLEDWLYSIVYFKDNFEVNIAGNYISDYTNYAEYNPEDPKYIISRIKLYYSSQKLLENLLLEMNRNQLIQKSKKSDNYKDQSRGRNRWERRNKSKIATRVDQYNKIDMNKFFKEDDLKVGINVKGETNDYVVTIRYNGALKEIQEQIKRNNNTLEFKCVLIALQRVFNAGNVFVSCSCPDWKYRQAYHATRDGYNSGEPEVRASDITNPGDTKGAGCKHVNLVLGNVDWLMKICSVINNYIHYMRDHFERKYADLIFPKLFGITYQKAVQLNLFDTDDELASNPDEIKLSNQYGRDRTRFKSNVRINNMRNFGGSKKEKHDDLNQPKLDLGLTKQIDNKKQA